jgi:hypothetical protein
MYKIYSTNMPGLNVVNLTKLFCKLGCYNRVFLEQRVNTCSCLPHCRLMNSIPLKSEHPLYNGNQSNPNNLINPNNPNNLTSRNCECDQTCKEMGEDGKDKQDSKSSP